MTEENLDHLPTIYFRLNFPVTDYRPNHKSKMVQTPIQTFSTAPVVANNTATSSTEKPLSVNQSEFDAYRKQFALSKKEIELQELLFNQVAGKNEH